MLSLAISPCPNDTFVFCALADRYQLTLDDVEALNLRAEAAIYDLSKISVAAYGRFREEYALLRAGGAAGHGVGPLLVAASPREPGGRIAIPGHRTTAALLLRLLGDFDTVPMRFDLIEAAVLDGTVDAGVLIHEGRFTYASKGLVRLADLGEVWEARMRMSPAAGRHRDTAQPGTRSRPACGRRDPSERPGIMGEPGGVRRVRPASCTGDGARRHPESYRSLRERLHARPR